MIAARDRSQPRAAAGAPGAGGGRRRALCRRHARPVGRRRRMAGSTAPAAAPRTAGARPTADGRRERQPPAKTYTVKAGDTPSGIAEKTGVSVERIARRTRTSTRGAQPGRQAQAAAVIAPPRRCRPVPRASRAWSPRSRRRCSPPAAGAAPPTPPRSPRRARIVDRRRDGRRRLSQARRPAPLDRLDDQAHDGAAHARVRRPGRARPGRPLPRARRRVADRPRSPGEKLTEADLLRGLLVYVRQRRGGHARRSTSPARSRPSCAA